MDSVLTYGIAGKETLLYGSEIKKMPDEGFETDSENSKRGSEYSKGMSKEWNNVPDIGRMLCTFLQAESI
ncbi:hypothetical protein MKW98_023059 [Papaver atlanticum]|uniref:Uncharacterized protein n=1 Tax=Papaver atlanticum TaxID=357466 RepID=A0AAD4TAF5_9MAGN|nr:hypothetical protein MKW98_023059 [Papaver atlanticum]